MGIKTSQLDWGKVFDTFGEQEEAQMGGYNPQMVGNPGAPMMPNTPVIGGINSYLPMYQIPKPAPQTNTVDLATQIAIAVKAALTGDVGGNVNVPNQNPVKSLLKNSSKPTFSAGSNPNDAGFAEYQKQKEELKDYEEFLKSLTEDEKENLAYIRDQQKFLISDERLFEIGKSGKSLSLGRLLDRGLLKSESFDGFVEYRITSRGKNTCEYLGI